MADFHASVIAYATDFDSTGFIAPVKSSSSPAELQSACSGARLPFCRTTFAPRILANADSQSFHSRQE